MSAYDKAMPLASFRLPMSVLAEVDALIARANAAEHGRSTRASTLQLLIARGIRELEREARS